MSKEPEIIINGKTLNNAQAMTVRCALESFASDISVNGLGEDETGKAIASGYMKCVESIRHFMYLPGV